MKFWLRYLAAWLVGTAAVYFLAMPMWERISRDDESAFPGDDGEVEEVEPAPAMPPPGAAVGGLHRIDKTRRAETSKRIEVEQQVQFVETEVEPPPPRMSLDEIPQAPIAVLRWSVFSLDSAIYSKEGKRFDNGRKIPGGTLAEIEKLTFTSKGEEMALCHLWNGSRWAGPVLVPTRALVMFEGTRAGLWAEDLEHLMDYCRINAALARRKADLEREAVDANPYAARLREMSSDSKKLAAKAAELTKERDTATGARRAKLADELRAMEVESSQFNRELQTQVNLYNDWKKFHPAKIVVCDDDPEWRELEAKLRAAAPGVAMFSLQDMPGEELPDE